MSINLADCTEYTNCDTCSADPSCGWCTTNETCVLGTAANACNATAQYVDGLGGVGRGKRGGGSFWDGD